MSTEAKDLKTSAFIFVMLLAFGLCLPVLAQGEAQPAQEPLVLTDEQGEYPLGLHMDILEDPTGELTIEDVTSPAYASRFTPSQELVPNYGYTASALWLRFRLRNQTSLTGQWLLESNFQNLNYIDLYLPLDGGGYQVKETGALRPFDTREIPLYHIVLRLPLAPQDEDTFYIRVESGSSLTLGFTLWAPEAFALSKIRDVLFTGLFYGSLLIILGYHLFLLYRLRETIYLYFIFFLASAILFFATYEGVADEFLWPSLSQQKRFLMTISMALFFMASMKFSDVFLDAKKQAPRTHKVFNLINGYWTLMILIVPFNSYSTMSTLLAPMIIISPAFAALAGVNVWRKGYPQARFFLVSWLGFLLGVMTLQLVRSDFLPSTPFTEKSYQAGLIWLVLFWSLALADRIEMFKKETEDANRKLIQSQRQLSQTLGGMPLGVVVYGLDRRPTYANPRAISILSNPERGIEVDIASRRSIREAIKYFSFRRTSSDQEYPVEQMPVWQAFEGTSASADDVEADLVDRRVPLEIWANPVKDEHGRVESVVAAFQDITQRQQMQAELDKYRLQLEDLVEQRTEQLEITNEQLNAEIAVRRRLEEMLRYRLEWLVLVNRVYQSVNNTSDLPQGYKSFIDSIKKFFGATDALLAELDTQRKELKLLAHSFANDTRPDITGLVFKPPPAFLAGQAFEEMKPVTLSRDQLGNMEVPLGAYFQDAKSRTFALIPMRCQGTLLGMLLLGFQEAEREFPADEIAQIERICLDITQVREKARLVEQTQALIASEERSRLARDLHDSVTQMLFAASLIAEVLPQIWRRDPGRALSSLDELHRLTRGALAEMRTMLLELRPSAAVKTPLSELLAQLTEAITSRTNLPFQLFVEQIPHLPEDVHIGFYRIAQESLNNVFKHAKASRVSVSLTATPFQSDPGGEWSGEVKLVIRDDGCGFAAQEEGTQHLGLGIMRERAAAIGAILSVESQPGEGTSVTLTWQN